MNNAITRLELDLVLKRIAHYASFSLSKERVLQTEPSFSALVVNRDLSRMKDALRYVVTNSGLSFGGVSDVRGPLNFAKKGGTLSIDEIVDIGRFLQGSLRLKSQFTQSEGTYESLEDLFESILINQKTLEFINHCFGEQGEVLDRASSELASIRRSIKNTEGQVDKQTQDFLTNNKSSLAETVVSYQRGRKTFLIKPADKNKYEGTIYGSSASGQSVYFEPAFLTRLQNELAGLKAQEQDEIERICIETSMKIGEDAQQLLANLETITILDVLFAKASWGQKNDGVVATLTTDRLNIKNARHPLIDSKTVVANTYRLIPPHRMILISGPNTGGKSVSLKTMGLAILLTLSGCPVLADEAEVMLVDKVFADIGDQQSIEKSLSSFSAHMETMTNVSQHATANSIVLLDELGSQTDPLEGESLSMAILDHFRTVGCWVIATTHFSRLKTYGTKYDDILIASVEFDLNKLVPTYKYRENIMGESNAFAIAKRLGLDINIINKAQEYKDESQYETDHLMEILENKIAESEDLKVELESKSAALDEMKAKLEAEMKIKLEEIEAEKLRLIRENDKYLEEIVDEAQKQLDVINASNRPDFRKEAVEVIKKMKKEVVVDTTIKVGDKVQLNKTSQVGVVNNIEKKTAFVTIGSLSASVPLNQLTKLTVQAKEKNKVRKTHTVKSSSSYKTEVNLIGYRVSEALPIMDKFIDDAILQKAYQFRIIHGVGTGQLRTAVHDRLRKNKNVASFELASIGEGGAGATTVKLKQ